MVPRTEERPKTIILKQIEHSHEEGRAGAAGILPGMAVIIDSDASTDVPRTPEVVIPNDTAGADVVLRVVKENRLIGGLVDDAYADGDVVPYSILKPGDVFMARVVDEFVGVEGDPLKLAADGTFVLQGGTGAVVAEVEEDVDYSVDPAPADRVLLVRARAK